MADIPVNTRIQRIDWETLVIQYEGEDHLDPEHEAYEFSNGRKFKETDKQGVYTGE